MSNTKKRAASCEAPSQPQPKRFSVRIANNQAKADENGSRTTQKQTKSANNSALTAKSVRPAQSKSLCELVPYATDIFMTERENEIKFSKQIGQGIKWGRIGVTVDMRCILTHWLIEVCDECSMRKQTLFLTINFIDRFLQASQQPIPSSVLQLIGISCLLVAAKYEEIEVPRIDSLIYFADDGYTAKEILQTECVVLSLLDFDLTTSTIYTFLQRFLEVSNASSAVSLNAQTLAELTITFYSLVSANKPSLLAASIVALSQHKHNTSPWTESFLLHTGYPKSEIQECMREIWGAHRHFSLGPQHNPTAKFVNFLPSTVFPNK